MNLIFIYIFGLLVGSFLNAIIYRFHSGQSIVNDSSRCPHCSHKLSAFDLIPVVSFFLLGRKCRYCKQPISWQYPVVELATGLAFVLVYATNVIPAEAGIQESKSWILTFVRMTDYGSLLFQWIFACLLIVIFVYDLKHFLILDKVILPAAALAVAYQISQNNFFYGLLGASLLSGFFGLLYLISKGRWIGFGDVKLAVFLGFLVPWPQTLALFFMAYFLGASVGVVLLAWGAKRMSDRVPFGTFLTLSAFLAMLYGEKLVSWYFGLIGIN